MRGDYEGMGRGAMGRGATMGPKSPLWARAALSLWDPGYGPRPGPWMCQWPGSVRTDLRWPARTLLPPTRPDLAEPEELIVSLPDDQSVSARPTWSLPPPQAHRPSSPVPAHTSRLSNGRSSRQAGPLLLMDGPGDRPAASPPRCPLWVRRRLAHPAPPSSRRPAHPAPPSSSYSPRRPAPRPSAAADRRRGPSAAALAESSLAQRRACCSEPGRRPGPARALAPRRRRSAAASRRGAGGSPRPAS